MRYRRDASFWISMRPSANRKGFEEGKVAAVWVQPQIIGPVKNGRPVPVDSAQEPVRLPCDMVIVAVGQGIESKAFEKQGIPVKRGVIDALSWSGINTRRI